MERRVKQTRIFNLFLENYVQVDSVLNIDHLMRFFVAKMAEILNVERVSLMLLDQERQELSVRASHGLNPSADSSRLRLGEMFGGWVAQQGNPLLVKDVDSEFPDLSKDRLARYKTKSFVIVPIKMKQGVIGVLNVTDRTDDGVFTDDDLKIINFLCHYFTLHIENFKLSEKTDELLTVDALTGLSNHRYFQEQLNEEIYRAERYRHPLSLLMLDIDNFCWYNQNYGYSAGDSALKQIGRLVKENTRWSDLVSRYGPEEFMVILPETRLKQAMLTGERIRENISHSIFTEDRTSSLAMARLTVSIGVVEHKIGMIREELIRRVVTALLQAKQKGKNCVCSFK